MAFEATVQTMITGMTVSKDNSAISFNRIFNVSPLVRRIKMNTAALPDE